MGWRSERRHGRRASAAELAPCMDRRAVVEYRKTERERVYAYFFFFRFFTCLTCESSRSVCTLQDLPALVPGRAAMVR